MLLIFSFYLSDAWFSKIYHNIRALEHTSALFSSYLKLRNEIFFSWGWVRKTFKTNCLKWMLVQSPKMKGSFCGVIKMCDSIFSQFKANKNEGNQWRNIGKWTAAIEEIFIPHWKFNAWKSLQVKQYNQFCDSIFLILNRELLGRTPFGIIEVVA